MHRKVLTSLVQLDRGCAHDGVNRAMFTMAEEETLPCAAPWRASARDPNHGPFRDAGMVPRKARESGLVQPEPCRPFVTARG